MIVFWRILIFIASVLAGVLILKYTNYLVNLVGYNPWAERYVKFWGGTYLLWKAFAILIILLGLLIATRPCALFGWWC